MYTFNGVARNKQNRQMLIGQDVWKTRSGMSTISQQKSNDVKTKKNDIDILPVINYNFNQEGVMQR